MLHPRLALALLALAGVGLTATACADQSAAIKVGDQTLSESDFQDELDAYWNNDALWDSREGQGAASRADEMGGSAPDSYSQAFVAQIIEQDIQALMFEQIMEDQGLELSDADRDTVRSEIQAEPQNAEIFDGFSKSFRDRYVEVQAMLTKLQQEDDQFDQHMFELAETVEVEVNPRYGAFDRDAFIQALSSQEGDAPLSVTPPDGPASNPEADDAEDQGDETDGSGQGSGQSSGG